MQVIRRTTWQEHWRRESVCVLSAVCFGEFKRILVFRFIETVTRLDPFLPRSLSSFPSCINQGLTLARPEIVPFRLTPYMVDGMGLCGFEGVYRRVMETCMSVLRTNRETLLSVLEPFLQESRVWNA